MKVSESWLREWVNPAINTTELTEQLTMAGLEVDGVEDAAPACSGIVVAQIVDYIPHPDADKLKVCQVDMGAAELIQIVCGAPNVFKGMKAPLATLGGQLGAIKIKQAKLRGEVSFGMLCSAKELGLSEDAAGLMNLPADAPIGKDFREYLQLEDKVIEIDLTPNRGDCLGIRGVAREIATLNDLPFQEPNIPAVEVTHSEELKVTLQAPEGCARYVGRIVKGINTEAKTPIWMVEKLRRSGIRSIHPVVDVTNLVLLELGHPMHGFDLRQLDKEIQVRWAKDQEKLVLLDGREIELQPDVLLIADASKPVALAGIMGGEHSGVADDTQDIFFESAWFDPLAIVGRARRFGLHTDASHRYERGVDPQMQIQAMERATNLLLEIAGGKAGPLTIAESTQHLPKRTEISLRHHRIEQVLGFKITQEQVESILQRLQMKVTLQADAAETTWLITPPSFRFDISIEVDLIEEIARIYGYNNIHGEQPSASLKMVANPENTVKIDAYKHLLTERGFQEVITYSFVDQKIEKLINPELDALALINPISSELAVMRTSLWQGLLTTLEFNQRHQQHRIRLFETGLRFVPSKNALKQERVIAGIITGNIEPNAYHTKRNVDFYDIKADVEALLHQTGQMLDFTFKAESHPALHPGQSASIYFKDQAIGWVGAIHPQLIRSLNIKTACFVFEIDFNALANRSLPKFAPWSKFPSSDRDLAVIVDEAVTASEILDLVKQSGAEHLVQAEIFDIYRGNAIDSSSKSVALGLIFSDVSRTLNDDEINTEMQQILSILKTTLNATLRE